MGTSMKTTVIIVIAVGKPGKTELIHAGRRSCYQIAGFFGKMRFLLRDDLTN